VDQGTGIRTESIQDDDEVRRLYLESWLGQRKYDVYSLNDPEYARHAAAKSGCAIVASIRRAYLDPWMGRRPSRR